jgi:hypothetical protein
MSQSITDAKRSIYTSAQANIGCAHFKSGAFVGVRYIGAGWNGTHWYSVLVDGVEVCQYPEHHLERFTF